MGKGLAPLDGANAFGQSKPRMSKPSMSSLELTDCGGYGCIDRNTVCQANPDRMNQGSSAVFISVCRSNFNECYHDGHIWCKAESDADRAEATARAAALARHDADVAAETLRLGKHRADEARRLVTLRENAAIATSGRTAELNDKRQCEIPAYTRETGYWDKTEREARADHASLNVGTICAGHPGTIGPLQCLKNPLNTPDSINSCRYEKRCPARKIACAGQGAIVR